MLTWAVLLGGGFVPGVRSCVRGADDGAHEDVGEGEVEREGWTAGSGRWCRSASTWRSSVGRPWSATVAAWLVAPRLCVDCDAGRLLSGEKARVRGRRGAY
ncbi:hypothetical protein F4780DRAFT_506183 [Xylariomycetidae sp. FL0641]|nr:hypothetical protein F4780DRAFT_506183 [Xylariomycetidae sp. FL0641]